MLILVRTVHQQEQGKQDVIITVPPSNRSTRIVVKVLAVERDRAKLGVEAPGEVEILRGELDGRAPR